MKPNTEVKYKVLIFIIILVSQLMPAFYYHYAKLVTQTKLEASRRARQQVEITPELARQLYQKIISSIKEEVKQIARQYLPALARLNFASDIAFPTKEENQIRDLGLELIDEMTKKIDLEEIKINHTHLDTSKYPIMHINGQFIKIQTISRDEQEDHVIYIYEGWDIYNNKVSFITNSNWPWGLSQGYRVVKDLDDYIWPKEFLNWPTK